MRAILLTVTVLLSLVGCSTKNPPLRDISNAKMALIKAESDAAKRYASDALVDVKVKYQSLQRLMQEKRFEEAQFLAQEIQADARLLQERASRMELEEQVKELQQTMPMGEKDPS